MNKATAEKVLEDIRKTYNTTEPALYPAEHEGLEDGQWSIAWEGSGFDETSWTSDYSDRFNETPVVENVFVEPMNHWCLVLTDV